jgi:hypothetical protein
MGVKRIRVSKASSPTPELRAVSLVAQFDDGTESQPIHLVEKDNPTFPLIEGGDIAFL